MIDYYKIVEPFEKEIIIKKSRFITTLLPIENASDAEEKLAILNKKYSDATHNCYAYISNIIATEQRFSDNGEPQGTAGIPMLDVLKKRRVYMTLAVVTRYFGGIKLGASGLVRAYSESVATALDEADIRKFVVSDIANVVISYNVYEKINEFISLSEGKVITTEYSDNVSITFAVPTDNYEKLKEKIIDFTNGRAVINHLNKDYIDYKI